MNMTYNWKHFAVEFDIIFGTLRPSTVLLRFMESGMDQIQNNRPSLNDAIYILPELRFN